MPELLAAAEAFGYRVGERHRERAADVDAAVASGDRGPRTRPQLSRSCESGGVPLSIFLDHPAFDADAQVRADRPPRADTEPLGSERMVFATPDGDLERLLVTGRGAGLVDLAVIPHFDHSDHPDASRANAARWASRIPLPTYAIDDESAVRVVDGVIDVVSEGQWERFDPR